MSTTNPEMPDWRLTNDVSLIRRKQERARKRISLKLSADTAEFFGWTGDSSIKATNVRWTKQFRHASYYRDERPREVVLSHRLLEDEPYTLREKRNRQTTVFLNDNQMFQLGELMLKLDCYNEPNMTYRGQFNISHFASRLLEAIAAGYIIRTWIDD